MRTLLFTTGILAMFAVLVTPALGQVAAPSAAAPSSQSVGSVPWGQLSAVQRHALSPLAGLWPSLNSDQQRKWVVISHNFEHLSPDEQAVLQSRMAEWARLTPAQRTQARLSFGELRRVPADEKKAKWEEYMALPVEERERLANDRPKPPVSAAPALRPVSPERILRPAAPAVAQPRDTREPRDTRVAPLGTIRSVGPVNRNTLLPEPRAAASAASR